MQIVTDSGMHAMPVVGHASIFMLRPFCAVAAGGLGGLLFSDSLSDVHAATLRTRASRGKAEVFPVGVKKPRTAGLS